MSVLTTSSGSAAEEPGETERRLEDGDTARRALDARTRAAELTLSAPSRSAAACSRLARRAANKPFGRAATAGVVCGTASGGSATGATDASCSGSGSGCGAGVGAAAPTAELSVPSTDTGAPDAAACRASRSLRERSAMEIRPPTAASTAGSAGSSPAGTASGTEASGAGTAASVSVGRSGVPAWICSSKANCGD